MKFQVKKKLKRKKAKQTTSESTIIWYMVYALFEKSVDASRAFGMA